MLLSFMVFAAAALLTVLIGSFLLPLLRKKGFGQTIRAEGPASHFAKAGTPTMGGLMFVLAMIPLLFVFTGGSRAVWLWLFLYLAMAALGFIDDMFKVAWRRSLGLTARQKLLGQFVAVLLFLFAANVLLQRGTDILIPPLGWRWQLGPLYYALISVFLVGLINGVNLTDGLDGLAAGVSLLVFAGLWLMCFIAAAIPPLAGLDYRELALVAAAMCGCCLGFLFFNRHPAKVFMGDTGSLALGGAVAGLAVLLKAEVALLLLGGVYLLEAFSVIIQVASVHWCGKRVFRMSPLHHHFEAVWGERRTVRNFWLLAAILTTASIIVNR